MYISVHNDEGNVTLRLCVHQMNPVLPQSPRALQPYGGEESCGDNGGWNESLIGKSPPPALTDGQRGESVDYPISEFTVEGEANGTSLIEMEQRKLTPHMGRHLFI